MTSSGAGAGGVPTGPDVPEVPVEPGDGMREETGNEPEGRDMPDVAPPVGEPEELGAGPQRPDPMQDRRILIDLLVYAWDRAKSPGVWARLAAGLEQVGVEVVRPDGEEFDPSLHEAGGVLHTREPLLHNRIAETETVGFRDGDRVIREPVVVVYQSR